jgi:hypothetical protein
MTSLCQLAFTVSCSADRIGSAKHAHAVVHTPCLSLLRLAAAFLTATQVLLSRQSLLQSESMLLALHAYTCLPCLTATLVLFPLACSMVLHSCSRNTTVAYVWCKAAATAANYIHPMCCLPVCLPACLPACRVLQLTPLLHERCFGSQLELTCHHASWHLHPSGSADNWQRQLCAHCAPYPSLYYRDSIVWLLHISQHIRCCH